MPVIYEPSGKAREYSDLACNLYTGCSHACKYCYCPSIMRTSLAEWSKNPHARTRILKQLENDAKKATEEDKNKELLFSFMTDPYQNDECSFLTRQALLIVENYGFKKVNVLTKAGYRTVKDFDIFIRNKDWKFGSTIIFRNEELRSEWEPGAPSIESRKQAIKQAKKLEIKTWVSIEPVVNTEEALFIISDLYNDSDFFKVGKLNHNKEIESKIDWKKFYYDVTELLKDKPHYIKKDLLAFK